LFQVHHSINLSSIGPNSKGMIARTNVDRMPRQWTATIILFIGILASIGAVLISWKDAKPESKTSAIERYEKLLKRVIILDDQQY
jgi:hypothetical protein